MNNPISKALEPLGRLIAVVSGYALLGLAFAMSVEIVGRKLFAFSFQGIDDIGGYVLAIVAVAGAGCGVITKTHVRIDIFLVRLPKGLQRFLNMLAMIAMAGFACFSTWRGARVLEESVEFGSRAVNPLQTPLWIPQAIWLLGLGFFSAVSCAYAVHAVKLFFSGSNALNAFYGPVSVNKDLEEELQALEERREEGMEL